MSFKEFRLLSFFLFSLINFENDFAQDNKSRISLNALTLLKYNNSGIEGTNGNLSAID